MSLITGKFFIFLCILLLAYYLLPNKKYQWIILLSGSLFFYTYASPYYLIFMVISSFSTYNLGLKIASSDDKSKRKRHVIIAVLINAGILFVLKYTVLLFDIASSLFKITVPEVNFILPLGISFYTFQAGMFFHLCYLRKYSVQVLLFLFDVLLGMYGKRDCQTSFCHPLTKRVHYFRHSL